MDKLNMKTPDITDKNINQIEALSYLFPNVITETRDEEGKVKKAVDFDLLRQILSKDLVEDGDERYRLDWPGKKASLLKANTPITKTLRPCREESVNFDTTENLYIEGDNFEVLKILQESYLGKVKMIYIDPPYNTGKDFIYKDDFKVSKKEYEDELEIKDEEGGKLKKNTDTNGRFHSDWLSMMYERLIVARDLLKDNGAIFISLDENEIYNLREICNEIFGEENFIAEIIWKKRSTPPNDRIIAAQHEYILCISKHSNLTKLYLRPRTKEQIKRYKNLDKHPKGPWTPGDLMANVKGGRYVESLYYPITNPRNGKEHYPSSNGNWRFNKEKIKELINNNEIYFGENDDGRPKLKRFLCDVKEGITWTTLWDFTPLNTAGSSEMSNIFGNLTTFDNPKPTGLLVEILRIGSGSDDIIFDFFSGSATTAHAVMQLNAEDNGNRKFIMVQLPEETDESSEAYKAGYKTIAEIGRERIRRAGKKILEENADKLKARKTPLDIGFRVYKTDSSNMKDVFYHPSSLKQEQLDFLESNIKEDRTPEDLLTQVLLDLGLELSLPIEQKKIKGNDVFFVQTNALVACFDEDINFEIIDEIAKLQPLKVVFKDASFKDDKDRINVEERFKRLSPETKISVL